MRDLLCDKQIYNYFIDLTYKIIPKKEKPYKLMVITAVSNRDNTINLCGLIGLILNYLSIYYAIKLF